MCIYVSETPFFSIQILCFYVFNFIFLPKIKGIYKGFLSVLIFEICGLLFRIKQFFDFIKSIIENAF